MLGLIYLFGAFSLLAFFLTISSCFYAGVDHHGSARLFKTHKDYGSWVRHPRECLYFPNNPVHLEQQLTSKLPYTFNTFGIKITNVDSTHIGKTEEDPFYLLEYNQNKPKTPVSVKEVLQSYENKYGTAEEQLQSQNNLLNIMKELN